MRRTAFFILAAALVLLMLPSTVLAAPTFNRAIDQLLANHYPQHVERHLDSLGDTTLGFRLAGTPADDAAAAYIASQFTAMGLANVREEGVPVDAWNMQGAWVQANGRTMAASQFDGVPGTSGPIAAPIVYVGEGTAADYEGKDVTGKLVLVDIELDDFWMNFVGHEATLHGALGVVATYGANTYPWYAKPNSLGANDGEYDMSFAPMVYISRADGAWLKSQVKAGPVTATMRSDIDITMHDFADPASGGLGYNVVGEIPGSNPNAKAILFAAHHDAHFRAGLDDTGATSNMLMIAKAMKLSGFKPKRTIIFLSTTGEEFGYTNAWYDWCAGAWWAATQTHASSAVDPSQRWTGTDGRVALMINLELQARKGAPLNASASTALAPWWRAVAKSSPTLLPYGYHISTPISTWEDGWTFTAAGVPALVMEAGGKGYDEIYHTNLETMALVDYAYLGKLAKFDFKLANRTNTGLLPYRLHAQAADLAAAVSGKELKATGADATTVDAVVKAVRAYSAATSAYEARKAGIPASHRASVNDGLFAVERVWNTNLTGMDIWDYQAYPFQQTLWDIEYLQSAIAHLQANPVEKGKALNDLSNVALTYNGMVFGQAVYTKDLERHLPDYDLITWGGQVNTPWHVDILSEVAQVDSGDYATAIAGLNSVVADELAGLQIDGYHPGKLNMDGLNTRLAQVTTTLNTLTPMVQALK